MPDPITPPTPPDAGVPTPPIATPPSEGENSAIRAVREHAKAQEARALAAETKLQEMERAKLDTTERLQLEKADLEKRLGEYEPIKARADRYAAQIESLIAAELETVPEDKRSQIEKLAGSGDPADRLENIRNAKALLPGSGKPVIPSVGAPARGGAAPTGAAPDPTPWKPGDGPPRYEFKPVATRGN